MPTFNISKATSLHFRIETGPSTINSGLIRDGNYLYSDIASFYNCSGAACGLDPLDYAKPQIYNEDDTVSIQVQYDNSSIVPAALIWNANTSLVVSTASFALVDVTNNIYEATIDMSVLGEGCFYVTIETPTIASGQNAWLVGDFGTHEANINNESDANTGNYAISRSNTQAQAGTYSYKRAGAAGTPTTDDKLILYPSIGNSMDLSTYVIWQVKCYVWLSSVGAPGGEEYITGQDIYWDITNSDGFGTPASAGTGYTDATILSTTNYNRGSDGLGKWVEVSAIFQLGTVTNAYLRLTSQKTPETNGVIYVDTISTQQVGRATEATSETFYVKSNHDCSTKATYTNADDGFDIMYTANNIEHTIRLEYDGLFRFSMQDPDYIIQDESDGTSSVKTAFPQKIYTVTFGSLTEAMAEKLILAAKHDTFKLDGLQLVLIDSNVEPEWQDNTGLCTVTMQFRLQDYNYQNSNC